MQVKLQKERPSVGENGMDDNERVLNRRLLQNAVADLMRQ